MSDTPWGCGPQCLTSVQPVTARPQQREVTRDLFREGAAYRAAPGPPKSRLWDPLPN